MSMANRLVISNIGLLATPLGRTAAVGPAQGQISQRLPGVGGIFL